MVWYVPVTSRPLVSGFQQRATDAFASWFAVDPAEHDEHAGFAGAADQGLGPFSTMRSLTVRALVR